MMIFSELLGFYRTALVQRSEWAIQANGRISGHDVRFQDLNPWVTRVAPGVQGDHDEFQ